MHKIILILFLFSLCSCNTWNEESKDAWKQACMENAGEWTTSKDDAKTYCDCVLGKIMEKYPDLNDALEHVKELSADTSFYPCRQLIKVK